MDQINNTVYAQRLIALAEHLEKLLPEAYFHGKFISHIDPVCGTVGCAFGHAVAAGMIPDLVINRSCFIMRADGVNVEEHDEADEFFGPGTYDRIFSGCDTTYGEHLYRVTREEVITRIRDVAAEFAATGG